MSRKIFCCKLDCNIVLFGLIVNFSQLCNFVVPVSSSSLLITT